MAIITFPTIAAPREVSCDIMNFVHADNSGDSLVGQSVEVLGAPWVLSATWAQFNPTDKDLIVAYLDQVRGVLNRTYLGDFRRPRPKGTVGTSALVNGANQTGLQLDIDNLPAGAALAIGDYFSIGDRYYRSTLRTVANGSGQMTVQFVPPILNPHADNAVINFDKPKTLFRLKSNFTQVKNAIMAGRDWGDGITIEWEQALV